MLLRKDDPWNLDFPDIRNWRVVDANDQSVGFVESVVIDTKENALEAMLTGPNERFAASDFEVDEQVVRLRGSIATREKNDDGSRDYRTYREAFQQHFQRSFADGERTLSDLKAAYDFGRRMALDADFSGREYERAREDLRAYWRSSHREIRFEEVESAIKFAYELVHQAGVYKSSGLEREEHQVLGTKRRDNGPLGVGKYTSTGGPAPPRENGSERR